MASTLTGEISGSIYLCLYYILRVLRVVNTMVPPLQ